MSAAARVTASPLSLRSFVASPLEFLRQRMHEQAFWRTQAAVLGITALHFSVEALTASSAHDGALSSSLHHLPVLLYIGPVAYAGLAYGYEGGILTGLWCAVLTIPNIVLWHSGGYEWIGELLFVLAVVAVGTITALPVERERRQRREAEAAARRLAILNDVAASPGPVWDDETTVGGALGRLVEALPLRGARLALWRVSDDAGANTVEVDPPVLVGSHPSDPAAQRLLRGVTDAVDGEDRQGPHADIEEIIVVPLVTERLRGRFAAIVGAGEAPSSQDIDLLTAVGNQLAVKVENAMLHREEHDWLESYVQLVTSAQEEERKRIARDLHDGAAQQLAALCRQLDTLGDRADLAGTAERLVEPRELAGAALAEVRQFSRDLRPTVLDDLGLVPALEWIVADLRQRTGIDAQFRADGQARRLPPETEVVLFRIAQEALRNVERHARAGHAWVGVDFRSEGNVRLSVRDDGAGFPVPQRTSDLVPSGKLGLMGMHERAQLAGGAFSVTSQLGTGTEIVADIHT